MNKLRIATIGVLTVALLLPVAVFAQEEAPERPEGRRRAAGEITGVVPGQGTFTMLTRKGEELGFQTNENTKFRSPDGSIEDIHDLKKGMKALVVAVEQDDGTLLALMVAAGNMKDRPNRPELDVKVGGKVTAVGASSLTIETRNGESISFSVNDSTHFKGISGLEELKVGMMAAVGATETDDGLLAVFVGARNPEDRPQHDPQDRPDRGPNRRGPGQDQGQEEEVSA